jgi:transposase
MKMVNRIFTDAMLARIREFAAAEAPTTSAAVAEMLLEEFGVFFYDRQVIHVINHQRIRLGGQIPNPIRKRVDILDRIRALVACDPRSAGNAALVRLIAAEFGIEVTEGQVAGAIHKEGISRGGPTKYGGAQTKEQRRAANRIAEKAYRERRAAKEQQRPETPPATLTVPAPAARPRYLAEAREQAERRAEMLRALTR